MSGVRVGSSRGGGRVVAGGFAAVGERFADAGADGGLLWPSLYGATVETACRLAARRQGLVAKNRVGWRRHGWTCRCGATTKQVGARKGRVTVRLGREVRKMRNWAVGVISSLFAGGYLLLKMREVLPVERKF